MKRYEYIEGSAAKMNFDNAMKTVFRAPKQPLKKQSAKTKPTASRKSAPAKP